ncbi:MAG: AAA family ATPase [Endomicrobium sp.]|jgi:predicted ATPase|nr:AAA family ATPase [Endomicrobium sp.]
MPETQEAGILKNIKIEGFKSIKKMDLSLNPLNIIIGQNGAGKSNFIGIFKFLCNIINKDLQSYVSKNGGAERFLYFGNKTTKSISISAVFDSKDAYDIVLIPAIPNKLIFEKEVISWKEHSEDLCNANGEESKLDSNPINPNEYNARYYLSTIKVYHFHDVSNESPIKKSCKISDNAFFRPQADNLPAMLYRFKQYYQAEYNEIIATITMVAPFFQDFILEPDDNDNIVLKWKHKGSDAYFDVFYFSDGTLRFIALATLLLQPDKFIPHTVIIDEPELGLHPYALKILAELMQRVSKRGKQVIATSQSVDLINEFNAEDIIVSDRVGDESVFHRLKEEEISQWLEEFSIGDIWSRNIIGGAPNDF